MDKDHLDDAKEDFKLCVDAEADQRKEALDDLKFALLGEQWHDKDRSSREAQGRPCLTINRLPAFIKQVTNDARQNRPAINVHPAGDGSDKDVARIFRDLIRNIENVSKADIAYDTGLDFAAYSGIGYWVVRDQYACDDSFDKELIIERVSNPFAVFGDYESKSATSDDWRRAFITDLYTKRAFDKKWKGAEASSFDAAGADEATALWFEEKRIRVAEYWTREEVPATLLKLSDGQIMYEEEYLKPSEDGPSLKDMLDAQGITVKGEREALTYKVMQRIVSGCETLENNEWLGKYIPIVPCYGNEINVNGKRYFQGLVRFAKDPQRMINYWRTVATESVALAPKMPYVGAVGAFATDYNKWQTANTVSHAYIEYDPIPGEPPPQRQPFAGVPAGAINEAMSASQDLKDIMGLHDASMGSKSNETSGRAIMARQREGDVSTFNFADNRNRAIEHTGTILVDLIPKHYNVARIIRCIKEDGSTYAVPINQHVKPVEDPKQTPGQPPEQFEPVPEAVPGLTKFFDLAAGRYDVTVAPGPSYTTRRQEASAEIMEFIRVFPQSAPLIGDILAKNQDWPGADEIAERLKAMLPPQAAGKVNPIVQQLEQQLQQQDAHAKEAVAQLSEQIKQLQQQLADKAAEQKVKDAEVQIKQRDMTLKERESAASIAERETQASAQLVQAAAPLGMMPPEAVAQIVQGVGAIAAAAKPRTRKVARATKQGDGSFIMESVEAPE
jgi:hypothetical protein